MELILNKIRNFLTCTMKGGRIMFVQIGEENVAKGEMIITMEWCSAIQDEHVTNQSVAM